MAATPLATPDDVAAIWHTPLTDPETTLVTGLILKASAKLRQQAPFDIDARMALFAQDLDPQPVTALDPLIVADVVATVVKRFLVNPDGFASQSQTVGPYSQSGTYVNRYDKTGSDVRGAIQITDSDIDQLRPATPADIPTTFQVGIPRPELLIPGVLRRGGRFDEFGASGVIVPDYATGSGVE